MGFLVAALVLASAPCGEVDAHGHAFATCFDPWRGVELSGALTVASSGVSGAGAVGVRLRGERESRSKTDSTWLTLHRFVATEARPLGGALALSALGYSGVFRRHVREGVLLLPTEPPLRVPFPLDISLMLDAARFERRFAEGSDWSLEPVRASVLFDPLRAASSRFHLGLGVTAAWRFAQRDGALVHDFTPLTAATLFFDFESEDGWWLARGVVSAGWSFVLPEATATFRARGEVELARVLVAVNDQPLSLFVRGSGAWRDAGARSQSELMVQAGLSVRLFASR